MQRCYEWRGTDADRADRAWLRVGADRMRGHGTSTTPDYALSWRLVVGAGWITRELAVAVQGDGWSRSLRLERSDDGTWRADAEAHGAAGPGGQALAEPGIVTASALEGAVDCDLGLCPVTNTMPIRRLGMLEGAGGGRIVAAWVEVPSLRVLASEQHYAPLEPGAVEYANAHRDFVARLSIDRDGVVLDYEGLAARVLTSDREGI